jgi:hypothetical protein
MRERDWLYAVAIFWTCLLLSGILLVAFNPPVDVPVSRRPSCQLGIALEDGKFRQTVVICKGPEGELIVAQ